MTKPQRATPHARRQFQSTPSVWRETCNLCRNAGCSMISIHSLRVEGDKQRCLKLQRPFSISIHSLRVEGDLLSQGCRGLARNFNPLPPCGGRRKRAARAAYIADFNPLPPCGGRPNVIVSDLLDAVFQSTPSVWRETENISISPEVLAISIHSLRVEGDRCCQIITYKGAPFQSTPSVWRETSMSIVCTPASSFQSTPSVWRETSTLFASGTRNTISIHSLRVEGDCDLQACLACPLISIHSLRVEGDFLSADNKRIEKISIHSLRVEGDGVTLRQQLPRQRFQSTPSVWRETKQIIVGLIDGLNFNPLPPCGGRHCLQGLVSAYVHFNPLPPCGGRHKRGKGAKRNEKFQSTPSVWRETLRRGAADGKNVFQSTPSVWRETARGAS